MGGGGKMKKIWGGGGNHPFTPPLGRLWLRLYDIVILVILKVRGDKSAKLSVQPWAGESTLQSIVAHTTRDIKAKVDR